MSDTWEQTGLQCIAVASCDPNLQPFLHPKLEALKEGQHRQESSNTASFVSPMHSEGKNAWTVSQSYTKMAIEDKGGGG